MKKKFAISVLSFLFITASAFVIIKSVNKKYKSKTETEVYELLPRKSSLAYTAEWASVKNNADVLLKKIKKDPFDIKSLMTLTALYLQEARATGNFNYYNGAALKCISDVLSKDPKNFEALTFKATILLSQHRFAEGLTQANEIQKLYPYNAYVYGLMVDGNVELGNYKAALEAADKMISLRPDTRSYSRIAYLREIHGDIPGAIEAMKMAVDAGVPGDENTEWCRVQSGKLYEKIGKMKEAEMLYRIAADNRQNYPYALSGIARIATRKKEYAEALALYRHADSLIPDYTFKEGMEEVYNLTGETAKAKLMAEEILNYMKQFSGNASTNEGQNEDHEMAHAYMGVGNYDKALEYALQEYNRRPSNIEVNETAAIVYYNQGDYQKALPYIETALKTNCKNPELLCHAGLIYAKAGKTKQANLFLNEIIKNDSNIPASLKDEAKKVLASSL
jgi:tetratricopeptide (TPR) repeat protein